jgi:Zn-finger nucleic acid-binding protein
MRCPIDHVSFVTLVTYDTQIDYCPKCGLWIDRDELSQAERIGSSVIKAGAAASTTAWGKVVTNPAGSHHVARP